MAAIKTMHALFLHELSDQYSAEQQLTKAMEEMLELAEDARVKKGLERHIAAQVAKNGIRLGDQLAEQFPALFRLQIERDALRVAVESLEVEAITIFGIRNHAARDIAAATAVFNLDDLGP